MKELAAGARIGHYEILEAIGAGGMGKVLAGLDAFMLLGGLLSDPGAAGKLMS